MPSDEVRSLQTNLSLILPNPNGIDSDPGETLEPGSPDLDLGTGHSFQFEDQDPGQDRIAEQNQDREDQPGPDEHLSDPVAPRSAWWS